MAGNLDVFEPYGAWTPASGSTNYSTSTGQSYGQSSANSFIPNYSQTPILENIAQYAENMAPQVYQWGMNAYNQNQGNINAMMRQALTYASPQRIASEMGMAESGVAQANEKARQASISDLQSYGVDPSFGRYAELDQANRVMGAAGVAGAGNQQRMATEQSGLGQQYQALSASMQNQQIGYGAANAMNQLLGTGMQLKYPPLGQTSQSTSQSTQSSFGSGTSTKVAKGGYISPDLSPSDGEEVDDVKARLNAGEYVIPRDVVQHLGTKHFAKLIEQSRKLRTANGNQHQQRTGYNLGGAI